MKFFPFLMICCCLLSACITPRPRIAYASAPYNDLAPVSSREYSLRFVEVLGDHILGERDRKCVRVCGRVPRPFGKYKAGITVREALEKAGMTETHFYIISVFRASEGTFYGVLTDNIKLHELPHRMSIEDSLREGDAVVVLEKMICF